jgi:F-type H+-transporting ATPase subunit f
MQRVVSFYEKLPRGAAPEVKPKGLIGRYQAKYFGKNPSATRMPTLLNPHVTFQRVADIFSFPAALIHAIAVVLAIGYAQNYYFHLRMSKRLQS